MPKENTTNLPILDDIIRPGDSDKAVRQPERKAPPSLEHDTRDSEPASTGPGRPAETPPEPDEPVGLDEPFLDEIIASYRPNLDSLTEEILSEIMGEIEPLIRHKILQTLKRHFPDNGKPE